MYRYLILIASIVVGLTFDVASQETFFRIGKEYNSTIYVSKTAAPFDLLLADLLANDIESVTGYKPLVVQGISKITPNAIAIGCMEETEIKKLAENNSNISESLNGQWEKFALSVIEHPGKENAQVLLIAGSDARGTAYGVFHLSEMMGVSPWNWWADVKPELQNEISVNINDYISKTPSVKYRGIFLNDEDWGLQPWAAKTFEPEVGNIGPKTYEKIFELLLRLKANMIWPAMHHCTKAFFKIPGNAEIAKKYNIFIGTSHAEPMMRNNVDEWDVKTQGNFNYQTNKKNVYKYWEERAKEIHGLNAIYTVGMRGVHDGRMEGYDNMGEKVAALEEIIADQREILSKYNKTSVQEIPQVFIPYKEVLEIYDNGLKLPEDITVMWTDDNYGYIRRLPDAEERGRSGGNGVYYHISYWGRPHDYLWLSTTHPLLIWEEMQKAYQNGADRMWVVNVGDIKPAELNMELFLDMAYDMDSYNTTERVWDHYESWLEPVVPGKGKELTQIFKLYYDLAWQRRPEFMGWGQTEYITTLSKTEFSNFAHGDEAYKRMEAYGLLRKEVNMIKSFVPSRNSEAFFQLIEYPVKCAGWMNEKFLALEKGYAYSNQSRTSSNEYANEAVAAYDSIVEFTNYYNSSLSNGKWENMMSMSPRNLPVYDLPLIPQWGPVSRNEACISLEGFTNEAYRNSNVWYLPKVLEGQGAERFIDVYLKGTRDARWELNTDVPWINLSASNGLLKDISGQREKRIWVHINWDKVPEYGDNKGIIVFKSENKTSRIGINVFKIPETIKKSGVDFIGNNGFISIYGDHFSSIKSDNFQIIDGLGYTGKVLAINGLVSTSGETSSAVANYTFYSEMAGECKIRIHCVPVHPVTNVNELRLGISIDQGNPEEVNFKTYGRSEEWKNNVLSNHAVKEVEINITGSGNHTLSLETRDPGVLIDYIEIRLKDKDKTYIPENETRIIRD